MARCSQGLGLRHVGVVLQRAAFDSIARSSSGQDTGGSRSFARAEKYWHMTGTQAGGWSLLVCVSSMPYSETISCPVGFHWNWFFYIASQNFVYTTHTWVLLCGPVFWGPGKTNRLDFGQLPHVFQISKQHATNVNRRLPMHAWQMASWELVSLPGGWGLTKRRVGNDVDGCTLQCQN